MKRFLFAVLLLLSISYSLDYSTLEMRIIDQNANPIEGAHFFMECKMSFTTVDRYLCTSDLNGTCKSGCMDCASGETAFVRAKYANKTFDQEITGWTGSDAESCLSFHPPSNPLGTFIIEVDYDPDELPQDPVDEDLDAGENLPENVNIETKDYHFSSTDSYEYESYADEEEEVPEESCFPAFAILSSLLFYYAKYSLN
ncbi:MAG: hypothetical protein GY852_04125 [bacterium]|nr:hypothetical protein [bacterium]